MSPGDRGQGTGDRGQGAPGLVLQAGFVDATANNQPRAARGALPLGAVAGALLLACALALFAGGLRQEAGLDPYPDLVDFFAPEQNAAGQYRFASPRASLFWSKPLPAGATLSLRVQSPPPLPPRELLLTQRGAELLRISVGAEARAIHLLLPPGDLRAAGYALDLVTEPARVPGDSRTLGLLFQGISLEARPPPPPTLMFGGALLLLALAAGLTMSLSLGWPAAGLVALLLALLFRAESARFWPLAGGLCLALAAVRLALPRPVMDWAERRSALRLPAWAALGSAAIFSATIGSYALENHRLYGTNGYDLGLYDQTFWLISRLLPNYSTGAGINMVGSHANLLLYPLAPLYWLLPDARTAVLLQVVGVALAAIPLYLIGRDRGYPWLGVAAGVAYLAHPGTQNMALFDFHIDALAATLLLFALWAAEARRTAILFFCCALVALAKENFAITVAWLGVWLVLRRQWREGLILIVGGAAWFILATRVLVPALVGGAESLHVSRFARYGESLPAIALFALTHPLTVLGDMLAPGWSEYLLALLIPFAFLPLLSPYTALALPALAINLLSNFDGQRGLWFHYNSLILAALAVAALDSACRVVRWGARGFSLQGLGGGRRATDDRRQTTDDSNTSAGWWSVVCRPSSRPEGSGRWSVIGRPSSALALTLTLTALMLGASWYAQKRELLRRDIIVQAASRDLGLSDRYNYVLSLIPPDAAVSAQSQFHPHLSTRQQVFIYPNPFLWADFYNPGAMPFSPQIEYVVLDTRRVAGGSVSVEAQLDLFARLEGQGLYERTADLGGLVLLHRVAGAPESCYEQGWGAEECEP
jgi:uncharacterized membrane protein